MGKAYSVPSAIEALGDLGVGLSQEVWWTPANPYKSSLTGVTSAELAKAYEDTTGREYNGMIGYSHSLFEVAADVINRAKDPTDKESLVEAIAATDLPTVVGRVNWRNGPMKNVCKTPLVSGQWVKGEKHKYDLVVVDDQLAPDIPVARKPFAVPY
jgi:branched-chain amino acid transport system substrate-binding protein